MSNQHSITALLSGVKRGDQDAIANLFSRCYSRVAAIGLKKLGRTPRCGFDQDDVANSAFCDFLKRAADGDFKKLVSRDDVWQVLTMLVGDKIGDRLRRDRRKKRGGGKPAVPLEDVAEALSKLDSPTLEAEIGDAKQVFLARLPSDGHRQVIELLANGLTHEEIARSLNLSVRTVDRRVEDIRIAMPKILGVDAPKKQSSGRRRNQGKSLDEHDR